MIALLMFGCSDPLPLVEGIAAAPDLDRDRDVVEVALSAAQTQVSYDGGETLTPTWAYNGQVPGPLIQAKVGDLVRVLFRNDLSEPTTIHWHGLRIDDAMDGVPAIQDPVQPGDTFVYEFVVPEAGTFWYHPHVRGHVQIERGLHGPLVVHEEEPPDVDHDRYFVLDDILLQENGRHVGFATDGMAGMHGRTGNVLLTNGSAEVATATVQPGTVERWRLVNVANARLLYATVRGASWRVVGVDGGLLEEPYTTNRLRMPVGRRFDIEVIPTPGETEAELRVLIPGADGFDRFPVFQATIEGEDAGRSPLEWPGTALPEREPVEQEVELELDAEAGQTSLRWMINGQTFGEGDPIQVRANTPTRLRVRDVSGVAPGHPFHLHGQFFEVVSRDGEADDVPGPLDTTHVFPNEELELYTTFDNPGLWMAHCHILEHAELGMMTSFRVE
jgi:FtsP/CotA-like multicopper oxidase with cupredoxin domain